jgi:hypothetical protein
MKEVKRKKPEGWRWGIILNQMEKEGLLEREHFNKDMGW